jgi:hypothetical protein
MAIDLKELEALKNVIDRNPALKEKLPIRSGSRRSNGIAE